MDEIPIAQKMQLDGIGELVRLVISSTQNRGGHVYVAEKDGKHFAFVTHLIPSWYSLKGLPVTVFVELEEEPKGKFISYTAQGTKEEQLEFTDAFKDSMSIHIPLIKVKEVPGFVLS